MSSPTSAVVTGVPAVESGEFKNGLGEDGDKGSCVVSVVEVDVSDDLRLPTND